MLKFVALCVLWYSSSALTNTSSKTFLNVLDAPATLTIVQFFFVAAWTAILAQLGSAFQLGWLGTVPVRKLDSHVWRSTAPMSLFVLTGHLFSSMATSKIPVSTVHTVKALSPFFTVVAYALLFSVKYSAKTYLSLVPLTLGVMLACSTSFTTNGNLMGLFCSLGSTIIFVSQNIFSKKVLFHERNDEPLNKRLDKMNLLFYSSFMAFALMIPIWLLRESTLVYTEGISWAIAFELFFNGTSHAAQNVLAFTLLSMVSPVTYSIASLIKRIFVIVVAIAWFGQSTNLVQALGICLTAAGLWLYDQAKGDVARIERKVEKIESGITLPMTQEDVSPGGTAERSSGSLINTFELAKQYQVPSLLDESSGPPVQRTERSGSRTIPRISESLQSNSSGTSSIPTRTSRRQSMINADKQRPRSLSLGPDSGIDEDSGGSEESEIVRPSTAQDQKQFLRTKGL